MTRNAAAPPFRYDEADQAHADLRARYERNVGPAVLWLARQTWAARWTTP